MVETKTTNEVFTEVKKNIYRVSGTAESAEDTGKIRYFRGNLS